MTSSGLYNALDSDEDDALCTLVGGEKVDLGGRWIRAFGMYRCLVTLLFVKRIVTSSGRRLSRSLVD